MGRPEIEVVVATPERFAPVRIPPRVPLAHLDELTAVAQSVERELADRLQQSVPAVGVVQQHQALVDQPADHVEHGVRRDRRPVGGHRLRARRAGTRPGTPPGGAAPPVRCRRGDRRSRRSTPATSAGAASPCTPHRTATGTPDRAPERARRAAPTAPAPRPTPPPAGRPRPRGPRSDEATAAACSVSPSRARRDHVGAHVRGDTPANDPPAEHVDDEAHVRHPGAGRHVREVFYPQRVGPLRREVPVHQIRRTQRVGIGDRREHLASPAAAPFDLHRFASVGRPGPGRCRDRPGAPPSTACARRRPSGCRPTTPSTPASSRRHVPPAPTRHLPSRPDGRTPRPPGRRSRRRRRSSVAPAAPDRGTTAPTHRRSAARPSLPRHAAGRSTTAPATRAHHPPRAAHGSSPAAARPGTPTPRASTNSATAPMTCSALSITTNVAPRSRR